MVTNTCADVTDQTTPTDSQQKQTELSGNETAETTRINAEPETQTDMHKNVTTKDTRENGTTNYVPPGERDNRGKNFENGTSKNTLTLRILTSVAGINL